MGRGSRGGCSRYGGFEEIKERLATRFEARRLY